MPTPPPPGWPWNQNPDPLLFGRNGNPLGAANTLRGGDTVSGLVGVMTYTWSGNPASGNAWRVRPIGALGGGVPDLPADQCAAHVSAGGRRLAARQRLQPAQLLQHLQRLYRWYRRRVDGLPRRRQRD